MPPAYLHSCPHCLMLVRRIVEACSSFMRIWFVSGCSGGQVPCPLRSRHFPSLKAGGGRTVWLHSFGAAGRQANMPLACLHLPDGGSSLHTFSAQVVQVCQWHACFPSAALIHSAIQTTAGHSMSLVRVSVAFGGQLRRPRQHRHGGSTICHRF